MSEEEFDLVFYNTEDPENFINNKYTMPASTTLLYKVCEQDHYKFEEALRLIKLFIETALKQKGK